MVFIAPKCYAYSTDDLNDLPADVVTQINYITTHYYAGDNSGLEFVYGIYFPNSSFPSGTFATLVYTPYEDSRLSLEYGAKNNSYVDINGQCYSNGVFVRLDTTKSTSVFPDDYVFESRTSYSNSYFTSLWRSWSPNGGFGSYLPIQLYGSPLEIDIRTPNSITYNTVSSSESKTDSYSDMNLLADFYTVTFTPEYASVSTTIGDSLIGNTYPCVFNKVRSDNGYDMISIQCMPLAVASDVVFYGKYTFHLGHNSSYTFDNLKLSFCTDIPREQPDEPNFYIPDDSFFKLELLDDTVFRPLSFTVNSLTFTNNSNRIVSYSNRVFTAFDYSKTGNSYPMFFFSGCANSNMYSAGSFIYNFKYDNVVHSGTNLDDDDIEEQRKKGKKKNDDERENSAYVPTYINYSTLNDSFSFDDRGNFDFSSVSDVLGWFFRNSFILTLVMACCIVGMIGYVLYGKR